MCVCVSCARNAGNFHLQEKPTNFPLLRDLNAHTHTHTHTPIIFSAERAKLERAVIGPISLIENRWQRPHHHTMLRAFLCTRFSPGRVPGVRSHFACRTLRAFRITLLVVARDARPLRCVARQKWKFRTRHAQVLV